MNKCFKSFPFHSFLKSFCTSCTINFHTVNHIFNSPSPVKDTDCYFSCWRRTGFSQQTLQLNCETTEVLQYSFQAAGYSTAGVVVFYPNCTSVSLFFLCFVHSRVTHEVSKWSRNISGLLSSFRAKNLRHCMTQRLKPRSFCFFHQVCVHVHPLCPLPSSRAQSFFFSIPRVAKRRQQRQVSGHQQNGSKIFSKQMLKINAKDVYKQTDLDGINRFYQ